MLGIIAGRILLKIDLDTMEDSYLKNNGIK